MILIQGVPVLEELHRIGGVQFGGFYYKYHEEDPAVPPEPIYLNLRKKPKGALTDGHVAVIAFEQYRVLPPDAGFQAVVGVPDAGDPVASFLAQFMGVTQLHLGKTVEGNRRRIAAGNILADMEKCGVRPGSRVLLCDDVITQAYSKQEAIAALGLAGLAVQDIVVFVDHEQGGVEALCRKGVRTHAVWTRTTLVRALWEERAITHQQYHCVVQHVTERRRQLGLSRV